LPAQLAGYTAKPWPGVLHALTALTRLCLQDVRLLGQNPSQHLTALARLPDLQHLHMDVQVDAGPPVRPVLTLDVLQLLQLLPLTYLHLNIDTSRTVPYRESLPEGVSRVLTPEAAQHISSLTRLQHLGIFTSRSWRGNPEKVPLLGHASQLLQLTQLTCLGLGAVLNCQLPALSGLIGLQRLELRGCNGVNWTPLEGLSKLQHLQLVGDYCRDEASTRQLLSLLQQKSELTHLHTHLAHYASIPAAAYAAIMANPKLQHLDLCNSAFSEEVWQHVFASPGHLPHLTSLTGCRYGAARASTLQACPGLKRLELGLRYPDSRGDTWQV
jgi:hypothetical protein